MLLKSKKEEIVKELEKAIKASESVVFVNFHGLNAGEETMLRRELRDKGVSYKVSRKTLLARAMAGKAEGTMPELGGEVAIAYSTDQIAPAREVFAFQKSHKVNLNILGGIFERKFIDSVKMMQIATIPSREVLYAQFVNLINSPIQRFAVALNEIAKSR
jgi:large subunit ribosomal protein L10